MKITMLTNFPGGSAYGTLNSGTTYELPFDYAKSLVDGGKAVYKDAIVPFVDPLDSTSPAALSLAMQQPAGVAAVAATMGSFFAVASVLTLAGIQAAVDAVAASPTGTGTVWLKDAVYDCSSGASITLKNGINIMGPFCPVMTEVDRIPDSVYQFSAGARLVGVPGQKIFTYNPTDNAGAVANPLVCLRGSMYRNIAFQGCDSGFVVGSYNNAGAVDCFWENILHAKTVDFGSKFVNSMHCVFKHLGYYACGGMFYQINDIDGSVLAAGNNIVDDIFGVVAVSGDGFTPQSMRLRRGHVLGCGVGGITGKPWQMQGVSNYGRIQANMFGRSEYTTGATVTVTGGSSDIAVPDLAEFPPGMPFQNVTGIGSTGNMQTQLVANLSYTVLSRSASSGAGTIKIGVSPSSDAIVPASGGTTTFKSKGYPPLTIQGRNQVTGQGTSFSGVTFAGLDLEGIASVGILAEGLGVVTFNNISSLPLAVDCYKQCVIEQSKGDVTLLGGVSLASFQQSTSYGIKILTKFDWANSANYFNPNDAQWPTFHGATAADTWALNISSRNIVKLPTWGEHLMSVPAGSVSQIEVGSPVGRYLNVSQTNDYRALGGISTMLFVDTANRSVSYPTYGPGQNGMDQTNYHGGAPGNGAVVTLSPDAGHTIGAFGWSSVELRPGQHLNTVYDHNRGKHGVISTNKLSFTDSSGTPGAATAHTQSGKCSVAGGATSVVITNALVHANAHIVVTVASNDATAVVKNVVPGAGSFTVNLTAPTAQTNLMWTLVQY